MLFLVNKLSGSKEPMGFWVRYFWSINCLDHWILENKVCFGDSLKYFSSWPTSAGLIRLPACPESVSEGHRGPVMRCDPHSWNSLCLNPLSHLSQANPGPGTMYRTCHGPCSAAVRTTAIQAGGEGSTDQWTELQDVHCCL